MCAFLQLELWSTLNLAQQQPTQALRTESFWLGLYCSIAEANTHHTARGGRQSTSPGWVGGNFLMYKIGTLQQRLTSRSTHDQHLLQLLQLYAQDVLAR